LTISLVISEETLETIQLTEEELRAEIAVMLFQQERLTLAQASHFANLNIVQFQRLLASRKIPLHYDIDDLREDVQSLQENNWQ
jgi:predicted HTH domain antitoxin